MGSGLRLISDGNRKAIVTHELGHILGLSLNYYASPYRWRKDRWANNSFLTKNIRGERLRID